MDDRRIIAKEDEDKVLQFQVEFQRVVKAVEELELQIGFRIECVLILDIDVAVDLVGCT